MASWLRNRGAVFSAADKLPTLLAAEYPDYFQPDDWAQRTCLYCEQMFNSRSKANRRCPECCAMFRDNPDLFQE